MQHYTFPQQFSCSKNMKQILDVKYSLSENSQLGTPCDRIKISLCISPTCSCSFLQPDLPLFANHQLQLFIACLAFYSRIMDLRSQGIEQLSPQPPNGSVCLHPKNLSQKIAQTKMMNWKYIIQKENCIPSRKKWLRWLESMLCI